MKSLLILIVASLSIMPVCAQESNSFHIQSSVTPLEDPIAFEINHYIFYVEKKAIDKAYAKSPVHDWVIAGLEGRDSKDLYASIEVVDEYRGELDRNTVDLEQIIFEQIMKEKVVFCTKDFKCVRAVELTPDREEDLYDIVDEYFFERYLIPICYRTMGCPSF